MHGTPNPYGPPPPPPRPPHGRPPLPGPPSPRRQRSNRQGWLVAGVALAVLLVLGGIAAAVAPDEQGAPTATASTRPAAVVPAYKVVGTKTKGLGTDITVEVDRAPGKTGLRRIFDDVRKKHREDGGYFVIVNCATGGTKGADNRLANGRYAVGREGEAATGLDDGKAEFEVLPDAQCPAG